jgi:hypothetical protein
MNTWTEKWISLILKKNIYWNIDNLMSPIIFLAKYLETEINFAYFANLLRFSIDLFSFVCQRYFIKKRKSILIVLPISFSNLIKVKHWKVTTFEEIEILLILIKYVYTKLLIDICKKLYSYILNWLLLS